MRALRFDASEPFRKSLAVADDGLSVWANDQRGAGVLPGGERGERLLCAEYFVLRLHCGRGKVPKGVRGAGSQHERCRPLFTWNDAHAFRHVIQKIQRVCSIPVEQPET